jgi:general L-amino acid transport system permease protein
MILSEPHVRTEDGPPTIQTLSPLDWLRQNLFSGWLNSASTLALLYLLIQAVAGLLDWGVVRAVWQVAGGDSAACRVEGAGACWALVGETHRFLLFGTYPYAEQWRPALVCLIFIGLYAVAFTPQFRRARLLLPLWSAGLGLALLLMLGGVFGLSPVRPGLWGGLPVTFLLATIGILGAMPLAVLLALGRRAEGLPVIRGLSVLYIELIRGVPLISVLFMASVMLPLFLPEGITLDKLLRAQLAFILFAAAYLAEVIRGGLQSIPRGQYEAAAALGLGYWRTMGLVIMPQALRLVIPPLVNTFIGLFKDTSLVVIIGIYDLLNAAKTVLVDPRWLGFGVEAYLSVASLYLIFCFALSRASRRLEDDLATGRRA